jgi:hypothetical protein
MRYNYRAPSNDLNSFMALAFFLVQQENNLDYPPNP